MDRYVPRSRRRAARTMPEVTLTPLIDTALTLLIIFMVTTPMIHNAVKVNLPRGQAKEVSGCKQELIIFIDKEGTFYLNNESFAQKEELIKALKQIVGEEKDKIVYLKADQAVHYGLVLELVDQLKVVGGIANVGLSTRQA